MQTGNEEIFRGIEREKIQRQKTGKHKQKKILKAFWQKGALYTWNQENMFGIKLDMDETLQTWKTTKNLYQIMWEK